MLSFVVLALLASTINAAPAKRDQKASSSNVLYSSSLPAAYGQSYLPSSYNYGSGQVVYGGSALGGQVVLGQAPAVSGVVSHAAPAYVSAAAPAVATGGAYYAGAAPAVATSGAYYAGAAPAVSGVVSHAAPAYVSAAAPAVATGGAYYAGAALPAAQVVTGQQYVYAAPKPVVHEHVQPQTYVVEQPHLIQKPPHVEVHTQVLPQQRVQQVSYVQNPQQRFVQNQAPVHTTSSKHFLAVPEEKKPKVYYSERVRETEGSTEQKENHKITVHPDGNVHIDNFDEHFANLGNNIPSVPAPAVNGGNGGYTNEYSSSAAAPEGPVADKPAYGGQAKEESAPSFTSSDVQTLTKKK